MQVRGVQHDKGTWESGNCPAWLPGEGQTDVALYNAVLGACVQSPGRSPQGLDLWLMGFMWFEFMHDSRNVPVGNKTPFSRIA